MLKKTQPAYWYESIFLCRSILGIWIQQDGVVIALDALNDFSGAKIIWVKLHCKSNVALVHLVTYLIGQCEWESVAKYGKKLDRITQLFNT